MDFDIEKLIEHAEAGVIPEFIPLTSDTIVVGPKAGGGFDVQSLEKFRDELRDRPKRIKGTARADTLEAFVDLVNRHKDDSSALFGSFTSSPGLVAVIDYHETDHQPRFGTHRISYSFPISPEWRAWGTSNGKPFDQAEWGAFLEDRVAELASPTEGEKSEFERLFQTTFATPADMMQLSRGLALTVEAKVKEIRVLQSGEAEIQYEETHKDVRGGKLTIPGLFVVSAPLFVGAEPSRIMGRLRYRKVDGRIVWIYQLYRPDEALRNTMAEALTTAVEETSLPGFEGTPEQ